MKKTLKKIIHWVVYSSANASNISMTVKGVLYSLIPVILLVTKANTITLDNMTLTAIIDEVVSFIIVVGGAITAVATGYGALRKVFKTAVGKNEVIIAHNKNTP